MVTKYLGGYQTPQYGWVTADPKNSGQNTALQQAANAYQQAYGKAVDPGVMRPLSAIELANQNFQYNKKNFTGDKDPYSDKQKQLLAWYQASQNQGVTGNATNKRYLDMMANELRQKTKQELVQETNSRFLDGLKPRGASSNKPFTDFGNEVGRENALNARLAFEQAAGTFGQSKQKPLSALGNFGRMGASISKRPDYELNMGSSIFGNINNHTMSGAYDAAMKRGASQYMGQKITDADKKAWQARQTQKVEGLTPFQTQILRNPNYYDNPSLMRYFDGPNADLWTGRKMNSWSTKPGDGSNTSMELGGETLADDVFNFYKNRSQAGTLADLGEMENNPFSRRVTFNGNNGYFTPYQYAIHGNEGSLNTNISSKDPNYWKNNGNLQQLDNEWGFVTSDDPTGGMTLSPENVDYMQKYKKKKGMFGGGFGSVLGLGMSALGAPWAMGIPSMVGTASSLGGGSSGGNGVYPPKVQLQGPQWSPSQSTQGLFRSPTYKAPKAYSGPKFTYQAPRG